mmetsp:Transcript_34330/g.52608  ORF Transcript_34330/g.52608 Transcript_34330/m.52608 type:complete len:200 (-) Transcript_34330:2941-3540(-)
MNMAAQFGLAKVHFFNGSMTAAEECLKKITADPKFKDCFDVIRLLAEVKVKQQLKFEAFALYKRLLELNPNDYETSYKIGELFHFSDNELALKYLEKGLAENLKQIETSEKLKEDGMEQGELILSPSKMVVSPDILNNLAVLRLNASLAMKNKKKLESKELNDLALTAYEQALNSIEKLKELDSSKEKLTKLQAWKQTI